MRIAVASHTFSNDELLRSALLAHFPDAYFNPTGRMLVGAELVEFMQGCNAAILGLEPIDAALLSTVPQLEAIAKFGVGMDNVDLDYCAKAGIALLSTPGVNAFAVAELTLGFMLALARRIAIGTHYLKTGQWVKHGGVQAFGKKVGLIGLGHVGKQTASVLQSVRCHVMAHDILDLRDYCAATSIEFCALDKLLAESDFVSLHVPLTPLTKHMIGAPELRAMKRTAFLINTARGGIVDEDALADALDAGTIAGAASDVFAIEPTTNARLLALPTFIGTAHVAGNSREAVHAVGMAAIRNLLAHFERARAAG